MTREGILPIDLLVVNLYPFAATVAKGYFEGSFTNVVSFLVDEKKLSVKELELLLQQLKKKK